MADLRPDRLYAPFDRDLDVDADLDAYAPLPPAPDPRPGPRADLVLSFLGVACDAVKKARHFAHTDEVARLTADAQARLLDAVTAAQRSTPRRPSRYRRGRRSA